MPFQQITNRQFASPSAANSATVAAAGVAWTNTAWVQIAATTDVVWILTGVIVWNNIAAISSTDFEVDIGTGGAGSEVVIATVRGVHRPQGAAFLSLPIRLPIPIDNLNGRHAFRLRTSDTRTDTWNVALTYIKNPVGGTLLVTRKPLLVAPAAATPVTLTASASLWANGSWAQLIAATAFDIVLTHLVLRFITISVDAEVDVGVGGAGSEVTVTRFRVSDRNTTAVATAAYELPNPLDNIPAGSRVALRMRADTSSAQATSALMYHEKPL